MNHGGSYLSQRVGVSGGVNGFQWLVRCRKLERLEENLFSDPNAPATTVFSISLFWVISSGFNSCWSFLPELYLAFR